MRLKVPFKKLVCSDCARELGRERGLEPDYLIAEVKLPPEDGRPARTVAIDVMRLKFEDMGDGLGRAHVEARVPCLKGDHLHDIDVSDLYRAPQLHIEGAVRCTCGQMMKFDRSHSWELTDDREFGAVILLSGILSCPQCQSEQRRTLRVNAPQMAEAETSGGITIDLGAATPVSDVLRAD